MQNRAFGKSLFVVVFSRIISLISSIVVGFVLPKILSVTDYGFYKVFTLYVAYTALLHLGFVDGILLKVSGMKYSDLNLQKMRTYTRFFATLEMFVFLVMLLVGVLVADGEYLFILVMLAVNMVFVNITTYYQFVSQAIQRFGEYSVKNIAISVIKTFFVLVLLLLTVGEVINVSYRVYLIGLNLLDFSIMIWYIAIYRDITFGKGVAIETVKGDIASIFKLGIVQTLAYQVSHLILALDRQFVSVLYSTEIFAVYSFAYNIVSMISTMVSSISVVLLPMLKNRAYEVVVRSYKKCLTVVAVIAAGSLLCFFPLARFVEWFLPEYYDSIRYIAIVLTTYLFTSSITVVMFTIYKVYDMNLVFFKDNCLILVLGFACNVVAYYFFDSPSAISYASLIVTMLWFLLSGVRLRYKTGASVVREFIYLFAIGVGFLIIINLFGFAIMGFVVYFIWAFICTTVFYNDVIRECIKTLPKRPAHN